MWYRKLGEVYNITRRNSETNIVNQEGTQFGSYESVDKKK